MIYPKKLNNKKFEENLNNKGYNRIVVEVVRFLDIKIHTGSIFYARHHLLLLELQNKFFLT